MHHRDTERQVYSEPGRRAANKKKQKDRNHGWTQMDTDKEKKTFYLIRVNPCELVLSHATGVIEGSLVYT